MRKVELGEMTEFEKNCNEAARFSPAGTTEDGSRVQPAVDLEGVVVSVYVQDGTLVISGLLDGASDPPFRAYGQGFEMMPVVVELNGRQVFAAHPDVEPAGRHHRSEAEPETRACA